MSLIGIGFGNYVEQFVKGVDSIYNVEYSEANLNVHAIYDLLAEDALMYCIIINDIEFIYDCIDKLWRIKPNWLISLKS